MTETEQRAAIERLAEWMGWRRGTVSWITPGHTLLSLLWNPFDNLNYVQLIENEIVRRGMLHIYAYELIAMKQFDLCADDLDYLAIGHLVTATAEQRAEACLRVIEASEQKPNDGGGL